MPHLTTHAPVVTFVIPIRHQDNSRDWSALVGRLQQTAQSIAAQTHGSWQALVVANDGAELPPLPRGFRIVRVGFPPNQLHDIGTADREAVYDAFRKDKGQRVLAGMLDAGDTGYFMIVDDDDFVSRDIVAHANTHFGDAGWIVQHGFIWSEGGRLAYLHSHFASFCGTSHIVRADLYDLPASADIAADDYIKAMLGSHVRIEGILAGRGTPLAPLPFPGAIYRVGHAGAHSKSRGILRTYLVNRKTLTSPALLWNNLTHFRLLSPRFAGQFGMKL